MCSEVPTKSRRMGAHPGDDYDDDQADDDDAADVWEHAQQGIY